MAVKLSSFMFSKRTPTWVSVSASYLFSSCTNSIPVIHEIDHDLSNTLEFEANVQFLRNNLYPDKLIKVLDSSNNINSDLKLVKWASLQKGFRHTNDTYFKIVLKLGLNGNVEELDVFCRNMLKDGQPNVKETCVLLIESFVKQSRLNEATHVLTNMSSSGYTPSIGMFNAVLFALVRRKSEFHDVVFVYKEMVKAGIAPNVDTLNYMLEFLFETGRFKSALDQFRRMDRKGCVPNSRTFEIVINALVASDRLADSVVILNEMFELQLQPDMSFFTCMIPLFCRNNKPEEGIKLFTMMRSVPYCPTLLIYDELITCLCHDLRLDDATKIFDDMVEIGLTPNSNMLVDVINGFCKARKFDEALSFLEARCEHETSPHNAFLLGCYDNGRLLLAISLLKKMSDRKITDCESWNILIRWFCESSEVRRAYELIGKMMVSSVVPEFSTHAALVLGNCRSRKYQDALLQLNYIHAMCWVLDSTLYSELIEGLCNIEKVTEAVDVFHHMSKYDCFLQSGSLTVLINSVCKATQVNEAIRVLFLAYSSGTSCTTATYTAIMLGLLKSGRISDLLVVFSQMLVGGCNPNVESYCILIQSMSKQNRPKDCASYFNMMVTKGLVPDLETIRVLQYCLANHSKLHSVSNAIMEVVLSNEILDSTMCNLLIHGFYKEGCKAEACQLLDLMLEKGWVPDAAIHNLFVGSSVKAEIASESLTNGNRMELDNVSNILADGLGEM